MDKEEIYTHTHTHTQNRILLSQRKNKIMSFAATRVHLEIIIPSEVSQTEKDKYHMILLLHVEFEKNDTNEFIYKTQIDPQT